MEVPREAGLAGGFRAAGGDQPAAVAVGAPVREGLPVDLGGLLPGHALVVVRLQAGIVVMPAASRLERLRLGLQVSEGLLGCLGDALEVRSEEHTSELQSRPQL